MTIRGFLLAAILGVALICNAMAGDVTSNSDTSLTATTQPTMTGRDTPQGAMNVYQQALARGDLATVTDSYNVRVARSSAFAKMMVVNYRFLHALETRFPPADIDKICKECQLQKSPTTRPYVERDWDQDPTPEAGIVYGKKGEIMAPMMQRGPDGIWRMGRIFKLQPVMTPQIQARITDMQQRQQHTSDEMDRRFTPVIANLRAGKYAVADDVINALYPEGSPVEKLRRMQARENADEAQQEAAQKQQLLAQHFDPSTVGGAVGCFMQAMLKRDRAGLERFFYSAGDDNDRLAKAHSTRILAGSALTDAMKKQFGAESGGNMDGRFTLLIDAPEWFSPSEVHGDTVVAQSPGEKKMHFRKIGGIWKQDITNPTPAAIRAEKLEQANSTAEKIIANILAGKYKTPTEVEDAIKKSKLDEAYHELESEE